MKKIMHLILIYVLAISAIGCSATPAPTTDVTSQPTTEATQATTIPAETTVPQSGGTADYHAPTTAISFPMVSEEKADKIGNLISSYRYPDFTVSLADADVAETITLDLLNRVDATSANATTMHAAAENNAASAGFQPYFYEIRYTVHRFDQNILSLYSTEAYYDGTPRAMQSGRSVSYDLSTGNVLNLRTILQEDYSADILCDMIIDGLSQHEDSLFDDYMTTIKEKFTTNVQAENWYFSNDGLCFFFAPYEIAPVSLGELVSVVSYDMLSGMLNEQFFPTEKLGYQGDVTVQSVTEDISSATDSFTQFSELTFETGTDRYLLTVNGSVSDLRIYTVTQDNEAKTMVYAAAGLGSADCILIEADAASIDQKLLVEWKSNNTITQALLRLDESGNASLQ